MVSLGVCILSQRLSQMLHFKCRFGIVFLGDAPQLLEGQPEADVPADQSHAGGIEALVERPAGWIVVKRKLVRLNCRLVLPYVIVLE